MAKASHVARVYLKETPTKNRFPGTKIPTGGFIHLSPSPTAHAPVLVRDLETRLSCETQRREDKEAIACGCLTPFWAHSTATFAGVLDSVSLVSPSSSEHQGEWSVINTEGPIGFPILLRLSFRVFLWSPMQLTWRKSQCFSWLAANRQWTFTLFRGSFEDSLLPIQVRDALFSAGFSRNFNTVFSELLFKRELISVSNFLNYQKQKSSSMCVCHTHTWEICMCMDIYIYTSTL